MTVGRASRLQGLEAFVETVDRGSFSGAAQGLAITRSAVAKAVGRLEKHLGVRLLERSTRAVLLTQEGRIFYENAVRALAELDAAETSLTNRQERVAGDLVVSMPVSLGRKWIAPVLLDFSKRHDQLRLFLDFTDRFVRPYEEGVDLTIRIGRGDESQALVSRTLATQDTSIVAAPSYLARRGTPKSLDDVKHHDCINFARFGKITPWRMTRKGQTDQKFTPPGPHTVSHGEAMLDAVLLGYGIANLPTWLAGDALQRGTLQKVFPDLRMARLPIRAIWPEQRAQFPRVRRAIDALVEAMSPVPPWQQ